MDESPQNFDRKPPSSVTPRFTQIPPKPPQSPQTYLRLNDFLHNDMDHRDPQSQTQTVRRKRTSRTHICNEDGCGKTFSRKEHLRRHQLNHKEAYIWKCQYCLTNFVRRDLWRRHWRVRHHGEEPPENGSTEPWDKHSGVQIAQGTPNDYSTDSPDLEGLETEISQAGDLVHIRDANSNLETVNPQAELQVEPESRVAIGSDRFSSIQEFYDVESGPGSSIDKNWLDWFADVQPDSQLDTGVDLTWLFGETQPSPAFGTTNQLGVRSPLAEHPTGSPISNFENQSVIQTAAYDGALEEPHCGFRVCSALGPEHRKALLTVLGAEMADIEPNVLALSSLRHGIHLFSRFLSKEYPILHNHVIAPSENHRKLLEEQFQLDSPPELMWAVITFGWSILEGPRYMLYRQTAKKIHVILRKRIITHQSLDFSPPLWLIQTLFLCLAFARYHGRRGEYGFATIFHGVLVNVVRRIDPVDLSPTVLPTNVDQDDLMKIWFKWIRAQTMIRVIFQTFILDIQQALLHGGDVTLNPFSLNFRLPESDDAWFAPTVDRWLRIKESLPNEPPEFLTILKGFWNSSTIKPAPSTFPRGYKVLMYGILSIAYDMRRRDDNSFSSKGLYSLQTLGVRVGKSFETWLQWWDQTYNDPMKETIFLWRNCACIFRLGHTLYEVGASEWQIIAGVDVIDGKCIGAMDYMRAKRKIKTWVKQDRAFIGLAYAATIIKEWLSPLHKPPVHCAHCRWCLYIAGLICWSFGFVSQGIVPHTQVHHPRDAKKECDIYLAAATRLPGPCPTNIVNETTGLLLVLIDLIEGYNDGEGLVEESVNSLKRLVGPNFASIASKTRTEGLI